MNNQTKNMRTTSKYSPVALVPLEFDFIS